MELDECNSRNHLDLIANVRPIVIIGEPQSVGCQKTKEELAGVQPPIHVEILSNPDIGLMPLTLTIRNLLNA